MKPKEIVFSYNYRKLEDHLHTTVRSVKWMKNRGIKIGDVIPVRVLQTAINFFDKLVGYYDEQINKIPIELLYYDTNLYNKAGVTSHQEFVDLLNTFIPKYNPNRLTTVKRVLLLLRVYK